jgi:hypothetical protein
MQPRLALQIGAVVALLFGLGLALAPQQMLGGFGLGAPNEAVIVMRDLGVTLIGVAVLNWLARDAVGAPLRAVLIGNIVIQVLELLVNGWEIAAGILPAAAAPGLVVHLILAVIFASALRRPEAAAA